MRFLNEDTKIDTLIAKAKELGINSIDELKDLLNNYKEPEVKQPEVEIPAETEEPKYDQEEIKRIFSEIDDLNNIDDWFDVLVPSTGKANSVAGEMIRAMMRILYRDFNDGDRFFSGYGVETCGGPAQYLIEVGTEKMSQILEDIAYKDLRDDSYTNAIKEVSNELIRHLKNNKELVVTPNEDDSIEYELDDEYIPKYDFDCMIPNYIQDLIDSGKYSEQDLEDELYYWEANGSGIGHNSDRIYVQGNYIYIDSIPEDMYNELERNMYRWLEDFADDLYNEYGEIEDEDEDEDDEE